MKTILTLLAFAAFCLFVAYQGMTRELCKNYDKYTTAELKAMGLRYSDCFK